MVKTIRISLDEDDHEKMRRVKGHRTWPDVLKRGIESLEACPDDAGWSKLILDLIDEGGAR